MNKFVFKKVAELTTEKTELSEVEIELASIQELEKASMGIYTAIQNARIGLDKASKEYRLLEVKFQKEFQSALQIATNAVSQFEKAAEQLGINPSSIEKYKSLKIAINVKPKDYGQMQQSYRLK